MNNKILPLIFLGVFVIVALFLLIKILPFLISVVILAIVLVVIATLYQRIFKKKDGSN